MHASAPVKVLARVTVVALAIVFSFFGPGVQFASAATVLMIGGMGQPVLSEAEMAAVLDGRFAGDTRVSVEWPAQAWPQTGLTSLTMGQSVAIGIEQLEEAVGQSSGPTVVLGISQGSLVVDAVQRRLATNGTNSELSFVTIADMNRGNGIFTHFRGVYIPILDYTPQPEPVTPYDTLVVAKEYDGWADFPDRPWNLVATMNAIAGSGIVPGFTGVHDATVSADLSQVPPTNITTTVNSLGGTTTSYLVPTRDLPLLQPLRDWGVPKPLVDTVNHLLKPVVDAGYSRNDSPSAATSTVPPAAGASKPVSNVVRESPKFAPRSDADPVGASRNESVDAITAGQDGDGGTDSDTDVSEAAGSASADDPAATKPDDNASSTSSAPASGSTPDAEQ
jgi:PE-PPE domain-containing protein